MKFMYKVIYIILILIIVIFLKDKIEQFLLPWDNKIDGLIEKLIRVHPRAKELQFYHDKKSYTINKKSIYLCIKDENGDYYEENMLIYAALHELGHVLCDEIGHTPKYWAIFDQLLEKAANMGIYDPTKPVNPNYCESDYHNDT